MRQKFCRWLAVLLSAVMLLWTGLSVSAAENTFVHTGSPSQDILAAAESQLGYTAPADGAKYNHWYGAVNGSYTYSWCQTFLSWCAEQAEIGTDVFPKAVSVASAYAAFAGQKRYQKSAAQGGSYTPRAGDVAFYSENGDADALSHVGLVTGTADGTLYTIEGNVSNQVQRCERQLDSVQIIGYGCPMYADLPNQIVPEAPVVTVDPGTSEYRTKIDWAECADAQRYLVVLWDSAGKELVRQESTDCYYYDYLTEGDYTVQVSACNGENYADSEKVAFRVEEHSQPGRFDIQVLSGSGTTPTRLHWKITDGAEGYRICIRNSVTGEIVAEEELGLNTWYPVSLPGGSYEAEVTAYNPCFERTVTKQFQLSAGTQLQGDFNNDGVVNSADVSELQSCLLGKKAVSDPAAVVRSDMNGDGVLNGFDLALLRQKLAAQ